MLIYLDVNIVQYCADYEDFLFGDGKLPSGTTARIRRELSGLRTLIDIELQLEHLDFNNRWDFAAPMHLIKELLKGRPTANQRDVYTMFRQVWNDFGKAYPEPDAECVTTIYNGLLTASQKNGHTIRP